MQVRRTGPGWTRLIALVMGLASLALPATATSLQHPGTGFARPDTVTVPLWPAAAPGERAHAAAERRETSTRDTRGPITRITEVHAPTLTVYRARGAKGSSPAALVFPGGAYQWLAYDIEGTEVCDWLTRSGITCVLVKYRVPQPNDSTRYHKPLQDAQRALGLVRLHARAWGIDAHRVGVIGFSAGAHLAAALSNQYATRRYPTIDEADRESCRPDFAVALYPGHMLEHSTGPFQLNPAVPVTATTPPTFILQAEDDPIDHVQNSLVYFAALKRAGAPVEMHLYAQGGHAFGLRRTRFPITEWPALMERWLGTIGVLEVAR